VAFTSCEKDIEIDLPVENPELVVDGKIENGLPPVVLLSKTRGLYEPTTPDDLANAYIEDAEVFVNDEPLTKL